MDGKHCETQHANNSLPASAANLDSSLAVRRLLSAVDSVLLLLCSAGLLNTVVLVLCSVFVVVEEVGDLAEAVVFFGLGCHCWWLSKICEIEVVVEVRLRLVDEKVEWWYRIGFVVRMMMVVMRK